MVDAPFVSRNHLSDKRFERQLNELQAYCIYGPKGCDWVGNFGTIIYRAAFEHW